MKRILFVLIIVSLTSCKSLDSVQEFRSLEVQKSRSVDTVVLRDSIFVREVQRGDTIYLTRTEYRDRWRTRLVHDTVRDTQYITQTIEHPPKRYVPKFYKWCTGLLWAIGLLVMGYWLLKWWLKRRV